MLVRRHERYLATANGSKGFTYATLQKAQERFTRALRRALKREEGIGRGLRSKALASDAGKVLIVRQPAT
jgi:hypothetical protein